MRLLAACGIVLMVALAGCSQGGHDQDGDGLTDAFEASGWPVRVDYLRERVEYRITTDAKASDSDGDGVSDAEEYLLGIDATAADTDRDGLSDCQELRHTNRTVCEDTAYAGALDGGYGTDPKRADSDPVSGRFVRAPGWFTDRTGTLPNGVPETGDGLSDAEELLGYPVHVPSGTRTVTTSPRDGDHDNDGLGDGEEALLYGGDPTVPDSDGDGCEDGGDPWPDRDESYRPRLDSFTLSANRVAGAQVQFRVTVSGALLAIPAAGSLFVGPGQTLDLSAYAAEALETASCTFPPYAPTVTMQLFAIDLTPSQAGALDIGSRNPGAQAQFNLDARTGDLQWGNGDALAAEVALEGADGVLRLRPMVAFQGS